MAKEAGPDVFAALANPARRGGVLALRAGPRSASALCEGLLPIARSSVAEHLQVLLAGRLVAVERRGRERICFISILARSPTSAPGSTACSPNRPAASTISKPPRDASGRGVSWAMTAEPGASR